MKKIAVTATVLLAGGISTFLLAQSGSEPSRAVEAPKLSYKAWERAEIEILGGNDEAKQKTLIDNDALTQGLNKLAEDGWQLIAIEQRHTRPITGPKGTTYSNPATYIFTRTE